MVRRFRLHGAAVVSFGLFACAVGEEGTSVPGVEARPQRPPSGAREDVTTIGSPAPSSLNPTDELPHPTELAGVQPSDLRVAGNESPGSRAEESAASSPSKRSCRNLSLGLVAGGIGSAHGMSWRNGQWRGPTPLGATLVARPGLATLPQGFLAVMRGASDALTFSRFDGSSWAPASLVAMAHNALDEPHLMPDTVPPILVFQKSGGEDHRKFAITYWAGHSFTPPSLVAQGADISFGPRSPSAAVLGSQLTIAHAGDNGALYTRSQGVSWAASLAVPQASPKNDLPTAVTVLPGGALLVVYSSQEGAALSLKYTLRTGSRWSTPTSLYDSGGSRAYSRDPLSLVTLDDGRALLVFRGDDTNMYFSLFDGAGTGTWTQPAPIASTPVRSVSPPSVAAVPCGAGAVVAFVDGSTTPTEIRISRFQGPGWSLPETVPALTGLAHVGIAAKSETSPALSP